MNSSIDASPTGRELELGTGAVWASGPANAAAITYSATWGGVEVTMASESPAFSTYYTVNGTTPDSNSGGVLYTNQFMVTNSTQTFTYMARGGGGGFFPGGLCGTQCHPDFP